MSPKDRWPGLNFICRPLQPYCRPVQATWRNRSSTRDPRTQGSGSFEEHIRNLEQDVMCHSNTAARVMRVAFEAAKFDISSPSPPWGLEFCPRRKAPPIRLGSGRPSRFSGRFRYQFLTCLIRSRCIPTYWPKRLLKYSRLSSSRVAAEFQNSKCR